MAHVRFPSVEDIWARSYGSAYLMEHRLLRNPKSIAADAVKWAAVLLACLVGIELIAGLATGVWRLSGLSTEELLSRGGSLVVILAAFGLLIAVAARVEERIARRRSKG